jgi:hypothetical protein
MRLKHPPPKPIIAGQSVSPAGHVHFPATHVAPMPPQLFPHIPQFAVLVLVSTQVMPPKPGHIISPFPVHAPHMPAVQGAAPQLCPHIPQFAESVWVLAQVPPPKPPHIIVPIGHMHIPEVHVAPMAQARPHIPQFMGSVAVSEQVGLLGLPHLTWVAVHWHTPDTHVPCPQLWPQVPQCIGSLLVSKQPVGQETMPMAHWHVLFTHISPGLQVTMPHITPPLELALVEVALVLMVPVVVMPPLPVVMVPVDVAMAPLPVDMVVPVEATPPVFPARLVLPPQPALATSAAAARNRGSQSTFRAAMRCLLGSRSGLVKASSRRSDPLSWQRNRVMGTGEHDGSIGCRGMLASVRCQEGGACGSTEMRFRDQPATLCSGEAILSADQRIACDTMTTVASLAAGATSHRGYVSSFAWTERTRSFGPRNWKPPPSRSTARAPRLFS